MSGTNQNPQPPAADPGQSGGQPGTPAAQPPASPPAAQPPAAPPPAQQPAGQDNQPVEWARHQQVLNELATVQQQLAQAQGAIGGHTNNANRLQAQLNTTSQQLQAATGALTDLNTKYGTLETQYTAAQTELGTAKQQLTKLGVYELIAQETPNNPNWASLIANPYAIQAASLLADQEAQKNLLNGLAGSITQARQNGADAIRNGSTVLPTNPQTPAGAGPDDEYAKAYQALQSWHPNMPDAQKVWDANMKIIEAKGKTTQSPN